MNRIAQALLALSIGIGLSSCSSSTTASQSSSSQNTFVDSRDGQTYKFVVIGTQTWMAQNVNYKPTSAADSSWCYNDSTSYCTTYGRLYTYSSALAACPAGWSLPDTTAWNTLESAVGGTDTAGAALKARSSLWGSNSGLDPFGFSALPGGYHGSSFTAVTNMSYWWTSTLYNTSNIYSRSITYGNARLYHGYDDQSNGFSVRCLKD